MDNYIEFIKENENTRTGFRFLDIDNEKLELEKKPNGTTVLNDFNGLEKNDIVKFKYNSKDKELTLFDIKRNNKFLTNNSQKLNFKLSIKKANKIGA